MVLSCCVKPDLHDHYPEHDFIPHAKRARSRTRLSLELVDDRFSLSHLEERTRQIPLVSYAVRAQLVENSPAEPYGIDFDVKKGSDIAQTTPKELRPLDLPGTHSLSTRQYPKLCTTIVMSALVPSLPREEDRHSVHELLTGTQTTTSDDLNHIDSHEHKSPGDFDHNRCADEEYGDSLSALPAEILISIMQVLPVQALCNCIFVNFRLSDLALSTMFSKKFIDAFNQDHILQFNQFYKQSYRFNRPRSLHSLTDSHCRGDAELGTSIQTLQDTIASFDVRAIMKDREFVMWNDCEANSFSISFATQNENDEWQTYAVAATTDQSLASTAQVDYRQVWKAHLRTRKSGMSKFEAVLHETGRPRAYSSRILHNGTQFF